MKRFLHALGIHDWSPWSGLLKGTVDSWWLGTCIDKNAPTMFQKRTCNLCNKIELREVA